MHPLNVLEFRKKEFFYSPFEKQIDFVLRTVSPRVVKKVFSRLPPHVFMRINGFTSLKNSVIDVIGVMCPAFPEEVVFDKENAIKKIYRSVEYALKQGANIIVLAGFTSIIGNQGQDVRSKFQNYADIVITSGNTFTAALAVEGVSKALRLVGRDWKDTIVAIVGASGDIGSACAKVIGAKAKGLLLCSRTKSVTEKLLKEVQSLNGAEISLEADVNVVLDKANVIISATSSVIPLINFKDIKTGSIICDVSLPYNVSIEDNFKRSDVFVFDGGKAKLPTNNMVKTKKWMGFTDEYRAIPGCLAEGMLLGLENKKVDFSLGRGNITQEKVDIIVQVARSHGFDVADFALHERRYSTQEIENIVSSITKK